jgi:hypothetical protein
MKIETILAIGGFVLALGSNLVWALVIFTNAQKKAYAAERDFNHLKNNQLNISQGIATGFKDIESGLDRLEKEVLELKAWFIRGMTHPPER